MLQVGMKVSLVDRNGKVLWENPSYAFRSQYELSQDAASFFEEESPALRAYRARLCSGHGEQHRGGLLMRSFAVSDRFVADMKSRKLAPGYVFIGDEGVLPQKVPGSDSAIPGAGGCARAQPL